MIHLPNKRGIIAALSLLFIVPISFGAYPELPPFNSPAKDQQFPGKLIWVDLVTDDVASAAEFYTELFGWESEIFVWEEHSYALLKKDGTAIAGIYYREETDRDETYGIWLPYLSVGDLESTMDLAEGKGGKRLMDGTLAKRGKQAIYRDSQDALVGFMQSASGDPDDYLADYNEFIWMQLWVYDVTDALSFYEKVVGLENYADGSHAEIYSHLLYSEGTLRGSMMQYPEDYGAKPAWLTFVRVESIEETLDKAKDLGAVIPVPPKERVLDGRMAIIEDPVGAIIVVVEHEPETEE